jgi:ribonucleoside-diphosphate reductase alpha chain
MMMLKAIALYRDSSKLSQPLNASSYEGLDEIVMLGDELSLDETKGPRDLQSKIVENIQYSLERKRLPKKRHGFVREAYVGGHKVYLRTGEYEDGSLGEIFIDMYKEGASFRGLLNSFAILVSKALQYGIPLDELVDTFTFTRFEPSGIVMGHEAIKASTSILDYVFRSLGADYLKRSDFIHIKAVDEINGSSHKKENPGPILATVTEVKTSAKKVLSEPILVRAEQPTGDDAPQAKPGKGKPAPKLKSKDAQKFGYTGEQCQNCGSIRVKRNGSCTVCEDCGETSGCS